MSKGLEALEELKKGYYGYYNGRFENIEKELKEGQLAVNFVNRVYDIIGGENDIDIIVDTIEKQKKALEIIRKYPKNRNSLANFCYMVDYWEKNNTKITKELLENYDFPFEVEEYDLLKEVLL